MRYRKLSPDNDYEFGNGQLDFWRDVPDAVGQSVKTRLLLWLGEWYLNITEGTPYLQGILGKHSKEKADVTIQDRVLTTGGVVDVTEFVSTIEPNTRSYSDEFLIDTIYGPTKIQMENYVNY